MGNPQMVEAGKGVKVLVYGCTALMLTAVIAALLVLVIES
jgi:hypothetical protein